MLQTMDNPEQDFCMVCSGGLSKSHPSGSRSKTPTLLIYLGTSRSKSPTLLIYLGTCKIAEFLCFPRFTNASETYDSRPTSCTT